MLVASKHFTIVVGIDCHFTTITPWNPIHPYIGIVFDVGDYIPFIGCNTYVNKIPRGASDTSGVLGILWHFPIATGPFAMTPMIGHESTNFFGGLNTYAEGCRLSPAAHILMTCNDIGIPLSLQPGKKFKPIPTLFAPTSFSIPIPTGSPVIVGGPYVPDWAAMIRNMIMGFGLGCLTKAGGKLINKLLKKLDFKWTKKLSDFLCKKGFEPVNLITGAVEYEGIDFEFPGPLPLVWKRVWYSDSLWQGILGHGCHNCFDMRLEKFEEDGILIATLSDGRPAAFEVLLPGESDFNRQEKLTLSHQGDCYELFDHNDRKTYTFPIGKDEKEHLLSIIRNEAGHKIQLQYNRGHLQEVIDSSGRRLLVETDREKRITKVELFVDIHTRETLVKYAYNESGDMTEITDALDKTTHIVYQNHLMVKKTDRNGQSFYWEYDGTKPKSRCVHTWGDGGILEGRIEYHQGYNLVTDSLGNTTRYEFTPEGYVTSVTDPLGNTELTDFTDYGNILREIDAESNITGYDYDPQGQLTAIHYPDNSSRNFAYDENGRLMCETTPEGATTIYLYNKQGLLEKVISPDNQVTEYIYNEQNLIEEIWAPGNRQIRLKYDEQHNLTAAQLPDGLKSEWKYDHRGKVIKSRNAAGQLNNYTYDALGRITRTIAPDGNIVKLTYNAYEEVIRAEDRERQVEFEYTPLGSLKKRKENGKILRFAYNTEEQLTTLRNEANERYLFARDRAGRIVQETGFDGLTRNYLRSPNGLVHRTERPGGRFSEYVYDSLGRLCGVEYHDGTFEQFAYNKDSLLTEARNPDSHLKITRDKLGRIIEEWQDGHTVTSSYNEPGQRTRLLSSLGANLTMDYAQSGLLQDMKSESWTMQLKYDDRGLEIERVLSGNVVSSSEYDGVGRIYRHSVTANNRRTRQMRYQWSQNDRLIGIVNELNSKNTWFDYDTMGNLVGSTFNETEKLFRVSNAIGNLYKTSNRNDRKYGEGGRLLEAEDTKYHYDEEGNLIEKTNGKGESWQYQWNANGSLREVIRPDRKKVSFEYDALGRRTAKIFNKGITRWLWDGNTPLHEWSYKLEQRPKVIKDEFGLTHKEGEEPIENLITWVFEEGSFKPAAKLTENGNYSIITDYLGTPAEMYDEQGNKTWEARLDIYGKIANFESRSLSECPFRYQGQYEDSETGLYYNRFRYYDPSTGSYISQDPIGLLGGMELYNYVCDPNFRIDPSGLSECKITKKLQDLADEAKAEAKLSKKQQASIQRSRDRAASATDPKVKAYHEMMAGKKEKMYMGTQVDTIFKKKVEADEMLKGAGVKTTPRGKPGPDVFDPDNKRYWDLTTETDWNKGTHQTKYDPDYGSGTGIFW